MLWQTPWPTKLSPGLFSLCLGCFLLWPAFHFTGEWWFKWTTQTTVFTVYVTTGQVLVCAYSRRFTVWVS